MAGCNAGSKLSNDTGRAIDKATYDTGSGPSCTGVPQDTTASCPTSVDTGWSSIGDSAVTGDSASGWDSGGCDSGWYQFDDACGGCPTGQYCTRCDYASTDSGEPGWTCVQCGMICGRPLRIAEGAGRARVLARGDWCDGARSRPADLSERERAALAAWWTDQALDEHASIASFARFTLELISLGAPAELVLDAQEAGIDEVRHARAAFTLAGAYAGTPCGPGPFDALARGLELAGTLVQFAVDTFVDGCLNETLATAVGAAQLRQATDPAVRTALEAVVTDETRHARLAWTVVAWAVNRGGDEVRSAVLDALRRYRMPEVRPVPLAVPGHGLIDAPTQRAAMDQAWEEVIAPVSRALLNERQGAR